jgi:hypothetical protein
MLEQHREGASFSLLWTYLPLGRNCGQKFQLQKLHMCAILSWHAGLAPEIGFSAPSMEQLWWIVLKCNQAIIT